MLCMRLTILVPAIMWLAFAGLSSAISHFAIILRDHAESDLIYTNHAILGLAFQNLMENILVVSVLMALMSTLLSIFDIVLAVHPRWLHQNGQRRIYFECIQVVVALPAVSVGGYIASCVHGSRSSFELLNIHSHLPYYELMYYGSVGQPAFGSLHRIETVHAGFSCSTVEKKESSIAIAL
ncbi:hypothetical protein N7466_001527 [Penicillium verhagenii]|uniref:uncharacterized protein n=1 Tax=Penicillium verhagenii TaxID=1562060 RepID=UPI0025454949|nr:uncharacterized protein N7466_001527 [Penicillium verhagenii]KAJ5938393.1 hypothetical protein N7466_001527 [Penicillium verhagenii]